MRTGIIYRITSPSGKVYVGQTVCGLEQRKAVHLYVSKNLKARSYHTAISRAIRKYKKLLVWEILHVDVPELKLDYLERKEIKAHDSRAPGGYNLTAGGGGGDYWSGKKQSAEHRRKNSEAYQGSRNHFFGKKHTAETRQKMSVAVKAANQVGERNPNRTIYKVRDPFGRIHLVATRNKLVLFCEKNGISFSSLLRHRKSQGFTLPPRV